MAGRNSLLNRRLINKLAKQIAQGNTDAVAISNAGIGKTAFYGWLQIAEEVKTKDASELTEHEVLCTEFAEAITRARDKAEGVAVAAVWLHIRGFESEEVVTETWYRKEKVDGVEVEIPVTTTRTKRWHTAPNAQVALEFLARRRRDNWSKNPDVQITNNQLTITGDQLQAALLQAEQKQRELRDRYPELSEPD